MPATPTRLRPVLLLNCQLAVAVLVELESETLKSVLRFISSRVEPPGVFLYAMV
jgi:hypothetical protein